MAQITSDLPSIVPQQWQAPRCAQNAPKCTKMTVVGYELGYELGWEIYFAIRPYRFTRSAHLLALDWFVRLIPNLLPDESTRQRSGAALIFPQAHQALLKTLDRGERLLQE
jgi:hypothetical protein